MSQVRGNSTTLQILENATVFPISVRWTRHEYNAEIIILQAFLLQLASIGDTETTHPFAVLTVAPYVVN